VWILLFLSWMCLVAFRIATCKKIVVIDRQQIRKCVCGFFLLFYELDYIISCDSFCLLLDNYNSSVNWLVDI